MSILFLLYIFVINSKTINVRKNINVIAKMNANGNILPLEIIWEDGRKFEIDKVLDIRKSASTKGGGNGLRFTVRIKNHQRYMWLDDYYWFIEI